MKALHQLAVAALLAFAAVGREQTQGALKASSSTTPTIALASVHQSHGAVPKPKHICGYNLAVMGTPGTTYAIYVSVDGGAPATFSFGTIPSGGLHSSGVFALGCQRERYTQRAVVTSQSDAPISVHLTYY